MRCFKVVRRPSDEEEYRSGKIFISCGTNTNGKYCLRYERGRVTLPVEGTAGLFAFRSIVDAERWLITTSLAFINDVEILEGEGVPASTEAKFICLDSFESNLDCWYGFKRHTIYIKPMEWLVNKGCERSVRPPLGTVFLSEFTPIK